MIALLTFPMMLGMSVLAEPLVLLIYGEKWQSAVGIVQVLCFAGLAQSVYNTAGWIFLSRGRSDILFRFGVLSMLVRGVGVLVGMHWGLLGIAWAYVAGGFLALMLPTWAAAGRLIGVGLGEMVSNVAGFWCAVGGRAHLAFHRSLGRSLLATPCRSRVGGIVVTAFSSAVQPGLA
jgi:PST family polysaccharide transporter